MAQIMTGARGTVLVDNIKVGFVSGVNVNVEYTLTDVDVLGQLDVGALAETGHKCSGSINFFKVVIPASVDTTAAVNPGVSSAEILGITSDDLPSMRDRKAFTIAISDEVGNEVFRMEGCKIEGGTGAMDARGVWQGTWNFRAQKGYKI